MNEGRGERDERRLTNALFEEGQSLSESVEQTIVTSLEQRVTFIEEQAIRLVHTRRENRMETSEMIEVGQLIFSRLKERLNQR